MANTRFPLAGLVCTSYIQHWGTVQLKEWTLIQDAIHSKLTHSVQSTGKRLSYLKGKLQVDSFSCLLKYKLYFSDQRVFDFVWIKLKNDKKSNTYQAIK